MRGYPLALRLPEPTDGALRRLAADNNLPVGSIARRLIERALSDEQIVSASLDDLRVKKSALRVPPSVAVALASSGLLEMPTDKLIAAIKTAATS